MTGGQQTPTTAVVPFYNEEGRVANVIKVALASKQISRVIAIDDASTDDGLKEVQAIKNKKLTLLRHAVNKGKTTTIAEGVRLAQDGIILLLDSDLIGLTTHLVEVLIKPIQDGRYDIVINDRDPHAVLSGFLSGERCFQKRTFDGFYASVGDIRYALEVRMDKFMIDQKLHIGVIHLPGVQQTMHDKKDGWLRGVFFYIKMYLGFVRNLGFWGLIQTFLRYKVTVNKIDYKVSSRADIG